MWITDEMIETAAAAIANARAGRRGAPPVSNVMELLDAAFPKTASDCRDDARAVLRTIASERPEERTAKCSRCGAFDLRVLNVTGGCCETTKFTEVWQKVGCMDCGQDLGIACNRNGQMILAHRELGEATP